MSKSDGESEKVTATQTDPWGPAVPFVKQFLEKIGANLNNLDATPAQKAAFANLEASASAGNPWTTQINGVADGQFGFGSNSGDITKALADYSTRMAPVADGSMLDLSKNPELQAMLSKVGTDAKNAVMSQFAGAGMTGSSLEQGAIANGITQAELPLLLSQYNTERGNQTAAAGKLFDASTGAATTAQGLDTSALAQRVGGVDTAAKAVAADTWGPSQILNLEQQQSGIPWQHLSQIAAMLLPAAGLGNSQNGTSSTSSESSSMSLGGIGSAISGIAALFSDERVKEDIEPVGTLEDGSTIYRYRYKGDPSKTFHIGLIAQEVEKKTPSAVLEIGGVKAVDYKKATNKAARMACDADKDGD